MSPPLDIAARAACDRLVSLDERVRTAVTPLSLAPDRDLATPVAEIVRDLFAAVGGARRDLLEPVATGLAAVVEAQLHEFPETVFWDFDFLAARLLDLGDSAAILATTGAMTALYSGYGRHSEIRFRYSHDFAYGFDWARWVARKPALRAAAGPFDMRFLGALQRHRSVLIEKIGAGEERYGRLSPSGFRNPYAFSREPDEERELHENLARAGWIPLEAWSANGATAWNRPFDDRRSAVAEELGRRQATG